MEVVITEFGVIAQLSGSAAILSELGNDLD